MAADDLDLWNALHGGTSTGLRDGDAGVEMTIDRLPHDELAAALYFRCRDPAAS